MPREETIVMIFVFTVIFSTALLALYSHIKAPKCTYTYDLTAKIIKSTCPIADAGLYDEVIAGNMTQSQRIADLHLKFLNQENGVYTYTFTVKGEYAPDAWVMVSL